MIVLMGTLTQNLSQSSGILGRSLGPQLKKAWWWCYPTPSEGWEHGGTPGRPNSVQSLDHRS